jgi:hypothetical protein
MRNNIIVTIIILLFASCNKDEDPESVKVERTIIVYMAADNDLWDVVHIDIEEMKQGYNSAPFQITIKNTVDIDTNKEDNFYFTFTPNSKGKTVRNVIFVSNATNYFEQLEIIAFVN